MTNLSVRQNLLENIDQYFKEVSTAQGINPSNAEVIDTGVNAVIVKFSDQGQNYALKIPSDKEVIPEIYFLKRLEGAVIKAPRIIDFDLSEEIVPFPYLITKWIDEAESFENEPKSTILKGATIYGRELAKLHRLSAGGFDYPLDINGQKWSCGSWLCALRNFIERNIQVSSMEKIFGKRELGIIQDLTWKNKRLEIDSPKLLHGDIPNGLMKIYPKICFLGFIDPNPPIGGDPMYDLSSIYIPNEEGNINYLFTEGLLRGYREVVDLDEEDEYRFRCLRLFHLFWKTCFFYEHGWNHKSLHKETLKYLSKIQTK